MKSFFLKAVFVSSLLAGSMRAEESAAPAETPHTPPTDEKVSYALGMNLGLQIKRMGADVDVSTIAKALQDVLDGKPTELSESDMRPIFMQSLAYEMARKSAKYREEGAAFAAKNAKVSGVTTLPDGVQYRIITPGSGKISAATNYVTFNYRGSWINGVEFVHKEHNVSPLDACPVGIQAVLKLVPVGTKVQVMVPADIAYGKYPTRPGGFGSTLVYDLELLGSEPPSETIMAQYGGGHLGHALDENYMPPAGAVPGVAAAKPVIETHPSSQVVLPEATEKQ